MDKLSPGPSQLADVKAVLRRLQRIADDDGIEMPPVSKPMIRSPYPSGALAELKRRPSIEQPVQRQDPVLLQSPLLRQNIELASFVLNAPPPIMVAKPPRGHGVVIVAGASVLALAVGVLSLQPLTWRPADFALGLAQGAAGSDTASDGLAETLSTRRDTTELLRVPQNLEVLTIAAALPPPAPSLSVPTVSPADRPDVGQSDAGVPGKMAAETTIALPAPTTERASRPTLPVADVLAEASIHLSAGRVTAARSVLHGYVGSASAEIAWAIARTHDINVLRGLPEPDASPNAVEAEHWYRLWHARAIEQGLVPESVSVERLIRSLR